MTVLELMGRLTGIGASVSAEGDQVAVHFPEERRREVEGLGPEIRRLKPQLMRALVSQPGESSEDIDLALKIGGYLATLSAHQSATASEIAEAFHGRGYTVDQVIAIYHICEELRREQLLSRGQAGYGYQLSCEGRTAAIEMTNPLLRQAKFRHSKASTSESSRGQLNAETMGPE